MNVHYSLVLCLGLLICLSSSSAERAPAPRDISLGVDSYLLIELGPENSNYNDSSSLRLITKSSLDFILETLSDVRVSSNQVRTVQVYPGGTCMFIPNLVKASGLNVVNSSFQFDPNDLYWTSIGLPAGRDALYHKVFVDTRNVHERPSLIAAMPFFWELSGYIEPKEVYFMVRKAAVGVDLRSHIAEQVDIFIRKFQPTISNQDFEMARSKIILDTEAQILRMSQIRDEVRDAIGKMHRIWGGVRLVVGDNVDRIEESHDGASPPLIFMSHNTLDITDKRMVASMLSQVDVEIIIAEHVLEHLLLPEAMLALRLLYDFLADGGALYLAVPDYNWMLRDSLGNGSLSLTDKVQLLSDQGWLQKDIDAGHHVQYDAKSLSAALVAAGFNIVEVLEHTDDNGMIVKRHENSWSCDEIPIRRSDKCGQSSTLSLIVRAVKSPPSSKEGEWLHVLVDLTDPSLDESDLSVWEPTIPILIRKLRRRRYLSGNSSFPVAVTIVISDITVYARELHRILAITNGFSDIVSAMVLGDFMRKPSKNITHIITSARDLWHLKSGISLVFENLTVLRLNTFIRDDDTALSTPSIDVTLYERNLSTISKANTIPTQFGLDPEYSSEIDIKSEEDTALEVGALRKRMADSVSEDELREHIMTSPYVVIPVASHQCRAESMCEELEGSIRSIVAAFREDERRRSAWEIPPIKSFVLVLVGDLDLETRKDRLGLEGVLCLCIPRLMSHVEYSVLLRGAYAFLDIGANFGNRDEVSFGKRNFRVYNSILAVALGCPVISVVPAKVLRSILARIDMYASSTTSTGSSSSFSDLVDTLLYTVPRFDEGSLWRAFRRIRTYYQQHALDDAENATLSRRLRASIMGWNDFASVIFRMIFY